MKRPRPTSLAAAGFLGLAAILAIIDAKTGWWSAWTPNLAASCLEIAATVAIVDRIVRREQQRAVRPLIDSAHYQIGELVESAAADLVTARWRPIFEDPGSLRKHLAEMLSADAFFSGSLERLDRVARQRAAQLERVVRVDRSILEPPLVLEIERLISELRAATRWHALADQMGHESIQVGMDAREIQRASPYADPDRTQERTGREIAAALAQFVDMASPTFGRVAWRSPEDGA